MRLDQNHHVDMQLRSRSRALNRMLVITSSIGSLLILAVLSILGPEYWSRGLVLLVLILIFTPIVMLFAGRSFRINFFEHFPLALLAILIVHVQYHIDFVLGNVDQSSWIWISDDVVMRSLALSAAGILIFVLTYTVSQTSKMRLVKDRVQPAGALTAITALLLVGFFATANPLYLAGYYGHENVGQTAAYFIQLFKASFFATIILKTRNLKLEGCTDVSIAGFMRRLGWPINTVLIIYLLSVVVIGDRGPLIVYPLCVLGNYFYLTKSYPSGKVSVIAILFGAFFISLLGDIRQYDRQMGIVERIVLQLTEGEHRFSDRSFLPPTQNLANSIRTLHTVVGHVPEYHPHTRGLFQAKQCLSIVPFGGTLGRLILDDGSYKYGSSSAFTTWIVQGDNPYSGEGTTCIADLYIDFGLLGVLAGMALYGFILARSERALKVDGLPSLLWHAVSITYLANAVYISRSPIFADLKTVAWTVAILVLNSYVFGRDRHG